MLALLDHGVADVGPVESSSEHRRLGEVQAQPDVLSCLIVSRSGERDEGNPGEEFPQLAQLDVLGPEVMPPLRDAVCLVDREQRDRCAAQLFKEPIEHQPFRRHIE
jgi:hypothetical protein